MRGLLLLAAWLLTPGAWAGEPGSNYGDTPEELRPYGRWDADPYKHFFSTAPMYRGPGREEPEPAGLKEVRLGLFTPLEGDSDDAIAGRDSRDGIQLALEEANAAGGYKGLPFRLAERNDQLLWGAAAKAVVDLAYDEKVWAVLGSIDSNSTHVAIRMALKIHLPFLNVGANSADVTETNIPWVIRSTPDDRQTAIVLAQEILGRRGLSRVAVLRLAERYGRTGILKFREAAPRLRKPLPIEIQFAAGTTDFSDQLARIAAAKAEAVLIWAKAKEAALIVRQLRARGMEQPVFGTDRMATPAFLAAAGPAAEDATMTYWMDMERPDPAWQGFRKRFRARYGREPEAFAAFGYDSARILVAAVRKAGLNRVRIRDELFALRRYQGVSGAMRFDVTSNNISRPKLLRVQGGRFVFH
ncbi:MAG: ABC transporter substrate-binding protein [Elusimicrobia bacterium]|nr:ABC transporter substrate-binding protein [Elusimicrobiota bacterium]